MAGTERGPAIGLWLRQSGGAWFGVAESGCKLVATSVAASRDEAARILLGCLPSKVPRRFTEGESEFADATALMLAAIEAGDETGRFFELSTEHLPEPAPSVFRLVAAIPLGYACSYGRIAAAAGTIARAVGGLMAANPLYPIVPCHRVVGSDYSLVGYRGATFGPDLEDKLARLRAEARGFARELRLDEAGGLVVFPVERVISKAARDRGDDALQLPLW